MCKEFINIKEDRCAMKQIVSISKLSLRAGLFSLLMLLPQLVSAQEGRDSTYITHDSITTRPEIKGLIQSATPDLYPVKTTPYPLSSPIHAEHLPRFSLKSIPSLPYYTNPSPRFRGDYRTDGVLKQFTHGALFASGGQTSVPGIGRFNDASLGFRHAFNKKWEMQLHANAMKINMLHSTHQAFSTSGAFLYHPSDRVTLKVFGSYDIGNPYGMSTHYYGASLSVDISERFGMEMGVERYYDATRGRWETVPVLIPYYRFKKFTLGLDVGGVLYEVLRNVVFDKKRDSEGPTIGPPRLSLPIR